MKKTFITIALAFGLSGVVSAATIYTTSIGTDGETTQHGWTVSLGDTLYANTLSSKTGSVFANEDQLLLTSVTITSAQTATKNIQLAVYAIGGTSIESASSLSYIGTSTNILEAATLNTAFTFNFSDSIITPTGNYAFLLFSKNASSEIIEGVSSIDDYRNVSSSNRGSLKFRKGSTTKSATDQLIGISSGNITLTNGTATATYITQTVPESTTASLGLLGLVALMMRRRVK